MQGPASYQQTRPRHPYPLPMNGGAYELSFWDYINIRTFTATANTRIHDRSRNSGASKGHFPSSLPCCSCMSEGWQMAIDRKFLIPE